MERLQEENEREMGGPGFNLAVNSEASPIKRLNSIDEDASHSTSKLESYLDGGKGKKSRFSVQKNSKTTPTNGSIASRARAGSKNRMKQIVMAQADMDSVSIFDDANKV